MCIPNFYEDSNLVGSWCILYYTFISLKNGLRNIIDTIMAILISLLL